MHAQSAAPRAGVAAGHLTAHLAPAPDLDALAQAWQRLQAESDHSFFQSWHWVGCLARSTGRTPLVLWVRAGARVVGLSAWFAGPAPLPWHRRLALSQLGEDRYDGIYVEYNGVLAARDCAAPVRRAVFNCLRRHASPWRDRLLFGGVPRDYRTLAEAEGWVVHRHEEKDVYALALGELVPPDPHLSHLRRGMRQQIRRSMRFYDAPPRLTAAADVEQAMHYLERLKRLHQASWQRRGSPGAFAEPFFERFHRRLVAENLPDGRIELVRIAAGEEDIGYLYNFIYDDRVYFYQSGLRYFDDNRARPGLVSHHLCIEAHARAGRQYYDFMAGTQRYKTDLGARPVGRLSWIELRRPWSELWPRGRWRR